MTNTYVPIELSSTPSIVDSATSTAITIASSGDVGIGITNPSDYYTAWNDLVLGSTSGHGGMTIVAGTGSDGTLAFADGTTGDAEYRGYIQYAHSGDSLKIGTSGTQRITIDSSGDISFYEDTGSTAKLFWDASSESLSIGTTGSTTDRRFQISSTGTATATTQYGIVLNPTYSADVTGGVYNLYSQPNLTSGSTVTNVFSLYMEANGISGSSVTNSYGIYQAGANDKNYFNGDVSIGHTSPSAALDIWGDTLNQIRLRTAASEYYSIGRNSSTGFLEFYGDQTGYVGYVFKNGNTTLQGRDNVNATLTIKTSATNDYNGYLNFDDNGGTRAFLRSNHYNNYFEINSGNGKYCFNTDTSANNGSVAMLARATTGASNNVYWFHFLEANDNQSAAGGKFGGILASASYSVAYPDRGDIYAQDNVSALSFTDRTPYPTSLQLAKDVINSHQRRSEEEIDELVTNAYNRLINEEHEMPQPSMDLTLEEYKAKYKKEYELDHSVLHEYVDDRRYADDGVECRDLSATASCLVEVVKNLLVEIQAMQEVISQLDSRIQALEE